MSSFSEPWKPEQEQDLPPARRMERLMASLLDEGIWVGLAATLGIVSSGGLITALGFAAAVVQDAPFGGGTSLGRRITDQVLVDQRGMECTVGRGALRNGLRLALWAGGCGIPLLLDIGLVLIHPKGLTTADIILGTQVVERQHAVLRPDQIEAQERRLLEG